MVLEPIRQFVRETGTPFCRVRISASPQQDKKGGHGFVLVADGNYYDARRKARQFGLAEPTVVDKAGLKAFLAGLSEARFPGRTVTIETAIPPHKFQKLSAAGMAGLGERNVHLATMTIAAPRARLPQRRSPQQRRASR